MAIENWHWCELNKLTHIRLTSCFIKSVGIALPAQYSQYTNIQRDKSDYRMNGCQPPNERNAEKRRDTAAILSLSCFSTHNTPFQLFFNAFKENFVFIQTWSATMTWIRVKIKREQQWLKNATFWEYTLRFIFSCWKWCHCKKLVPNCKTNILPK